MKLLNTFISEKLILNKDSKKKTFTDEELRKDYKDVGDTFSKSEKLPFMQKYGIKENKIKVIQAEILRLLQVSRNQRKEFTKEDITDFYRTNIPDGQYSKAEKMFDNESIEFIEYFKSVVEQGKRYLDARNNFRRLGAFSRISQADRSVLNLYDNICRYLEEHK